MSGGTPERGLVVHVGPPKTATTTIQLRMMALAPVLAGLGMSYVDNDHGIASHHRLAEVLRRIDGQGRREDSWFRATEQGLAPEDLFAPGLPRALVSSESLARVGRRGAQTLAARSGATSVRVVAAVRGPERWLWSGWQETCKTPDWREWEEYVRRSTGRGRHFPSRFLGSWCPPAADAAETTVRLFDLDALRTGSVVGDFCEAAGIPEAAAARPPGGRGDGADGAGEGTDGEGAAGDGADWAGDGGGTYPASVNEGMAALEALYTAALVAEVRRVLAGPLWPFAGPIPEGFVARCCLDVVTVARPMHERGRGSGWRPPGPGPVLFDRGTADLVAAYTAAWAADAAAVADTFDGLDDASRELLRAAAERARARLDAGGLWRPHPDGYPATGFADVLPVDAEFLAAARTIAAAVTQLARLAGCGV